MCSTVFFPPYELVLFGILVSADCCVTCRLTSVTRFNQGYVHKGDFLTSFFVRKVRIVRSYRASLYSSVLFRYKIE
jgi:hypothetical protein